MVEGIYTHRAGEKGMAPGNTDGLSLLGKRGNLEIMAQRVTRGATVWLSPGGSPEDFGMSNDDLRMEFPTRQEACAYANSLSVEDICPLLK